MSMIKDCYRLQATGHRLPRKDFQSTGQAGCRLYRSQATCNLKLEARGMKGSVKNKMKTTEDTEFTEDKYPYSKITDKIIKCAIEIHRTLLKQKLI